MAAAKARSTLTLAAALVASLACAVLASSASASTVWLCRPGLAPDPCTLPLTATVLGPTGAARSTEHATFPARPPIDCFYVYPTVSTQPTAVANLHIDPEEIAVAHSQASRFSLVCRVFAPMYRQGTLGAIFGHPSATPQQRAQAYADVRSAFFDYLAHYNHGRGFVLIGHSQGSFILRTLAHNEIDPKPSIRRRLVSALIFGGNVLVRRGSDRGGDFRNIPACRVGSQTGCVVAYSTFSTEPATISFGHSTDPRMEVLCTNPAALGGGSGMLAPYFLAAGFPNLLGLKPGDFPGLTLPFSTPWLTLPGAYRARCLSSSTANVLEVTPVAPWPTPKQSVGPRWGLHVADVNIALGNLVDLVRRQTAAYLRH